MRTAWVRPFSPCVFVHHSSYSCLVVLFGQRWRVLYHFIHRLFRLMDYYSPSFLIQHFKVAIRDDAEDFDYNVVFQVEACHLCQSALCSRRRLVDSPRNQSTQGGGRSLFQPFPSSRGVCQACWSQCLVATGERGAHDSIDSHQSKQRKHWRCHVLNALQPLIG